MLSSLFLLPILLCNSETITIPTKLGNITGSVQETSWSANIYLFGGIRYSVPPLGELRFRPATLLNDAYNGTYDATNFGASCTQPTNSISKDNTTVSEDCLFLNIWTSNVSPVNKLLPVMFWIHGGFFEYGSGADAAYNGNNIIGETDGDFVYVSINYRLGTIGFLQNEEIYNEDNDNWKSYGGMNGVYDQITALKWVKNNIADYGGDPNKITIFGESAGGLSVCVLLLSPMVPTNIFQRAIIESGTCNGAWGPVGAQTGLNACNKALEKAGYPTNNLTYLRSIDAATFISSVSCGVCVDDLILPDIPTNLFTQLAENKYNIFNARDGVIIGWTSVDALAQQFGGYAPTNEKEWTQTMSHYFPNKTQQNLMTNTYYSPDRFPAEMKDNNYQMAWYTINSDTCLGCPSILMAQQIIQSGMVNNVYIYVFGGPTSKNGANYASHGAELSFVFDWKPVKDTEWSQSLSDSMVSAWTNYGIYGNPNVTNKIDNINTIWNPFNDKNSMMIWNDTGKVIESKTYQNGACGFLITQNGFSMEDICNDGNPKYFPDQ